MQLALDGVELRDEVAGGVAGLDAAALGDRDTAGVYPGNGDDRSSDDLPECLFEVADAARSGQLTCGGAQGDDETVVLPGVHGCAPRWLRRGGHEAHNEECAGQAEPKRHALRSALPTGWGGRGRT